jgi:hypothetical protein
MRVKFIVRYDIVRDMDMDDQIKRVKMTAFWDTGLCSLLEASIIRVSETSGNFDKTTLHSAVSQKAVVFINAAVRT